MASLIRSCGQDWRTGLSASPVHRAKRCLPADLAEYMAPSARWSSFSGASGGDSNQAIPTEAPRFMPGYRSPSARMRASSRWAMASTAMRLASVKSTANSSPPQPRRHVAGAHRVADAVGDALEELVALDVAALVVEVLEVVDV